MIQSWERLVTDGLTDGRTDAQTDESDFIGRCPTNVKRPIFLSYEKIVTWTLNKDQVKNNHALLLSKSEPCFRSF